MLEIAWDFALKILGIIMPFIARWMYKSKTFDASIKIRISSEGEGITYNCGELPTARIWLLISNFTPFQLEIDRIYGQLAYGGVFGEITHLERHCIKPAQEEKVFIQVWLTEHQVQYIRRNANKNESQIYLSAYVISKIYNLKLSRTIRTSNTELVNCNPV
jgi:hypothetical protein